jgi:hypothetical protein
MSDSKDVLLPVGRIVSGNLYTASDKDADGKPRLIKNGPKAGQPTSQYYFGLAIPKTPGATHFGQEPWGAQFWALGNHAFPKIAESPTFSWKVIDGDSAIPNTKGNAPKDQTGYPGHWIVSLTRNGEMGPFKITNGDGSAYLLDPNVVQAGDLVEVHVTILGNDSTQRPGIYVNANIVAFVGYSPLGRIAQGVDPKSLGLGKSARPSTVAAPIGGSTAPAPAAPVPGAAAPAPPLPPALPGAAPPVPGAAIPGPVGVVPAPAYLAVPPTPPAPPAPPAAAKVLKGAFAAYSYEAVIGQGWTNASLIAAGYLDP